MGSDQEKPRESKEIDVPNSLIFLDNPMDEE